MTTMIIDNKATAKKSYEYYCIDRKEYPTEKDLEMLAYECMNDDVYSITICIDAVTLMKITNT